MARMVIDDHLWSKLVKLLPERKTGGRPGNNDRLFIEGVCWVIRTGAPWRDMPPEYGSWKTTYNRYNMLVDKAYDDGEFRIFLESRGTIAVIPSKKNRLEQIPHDKHIYKERNFVERFFNRIKQFRRVATRYDKLSITFMGTILVASILMWLKG